MLISFNKTLGNDRILKRELNSKISILSIIHKIHPINTSISLVKAITDAIDLAFTKHNRQLREHTTMLSIPLGDKAVKLNFTRVPNSWVNLLER
jgi:hypothetical protein